MNMKTCTTCKHEKPLTDFYKHPNMAQGRMSKCKKCKISYTSQYATENRDKRREWNDRWVEKNPEANAECKRNWNSQNPETRRHHDAIRRTRKKLAYVPGHEAELKALYALVPTIERLLGETCHVDHIIPLACGGTHEPTNLQIIPARINLAKGAKQDFDYTVAA